MSNDKLDILGIPVNKSNVKQILDTIDFYLRNEKKLFFSYINVHVAMQTKWNRHLSHSLNCFTYLYPDGIGIYLASRLLYGSNGLETRINGTDLYYYILDYITKNGFSVFFWGGSKNSVRKLQHSLKNNFPELKIVDIKDRETESSYVEQILQTLQVDFLFIGLGTPVQEIWLANNFNRIDVKVAFPVGSGIDYLSGELKRAPVVFRKLGLEWLYRLIRNPTKYWFRYTFENIIFIIIILQSHLKKKLSVKK